MSDEIEIYGINNCDSVKKAIKYLESKSIGYQFIDYRKNPISTEKLEKILSLVGWEKLINRRSTTYRSLSEEQKMNIDFDLLFNYPTLIKRPVLIFGKVILVGFNEDEYATLISQN